MPRALSEAYREQIGLPIMQAWGMTETSPVASVGRIKSTLEASSPTTRRPTCARPSGQIALGVEFRVVEPGTLEQLPWDGETSRRAAGARPVDRAPRTTTTTAPRESFTDDGWLQTGDMAVVDAEAYIRLVDRTKDVIKSGGEWISSVELENEIMGHPKVAEAAVIGVPHPKWSERPLACVVVKPGESSRRKSVLECLADKVAKWWLPDDVVFIDEVPKTSVGKFSKKTLRDRFADTCSCRDPAGASGARRCARQSCRSVTPGLRARGRRAPPRAPLRPRPSWVTGQRRVVSNGH